MPALNPLTGLGGLNPFGGAPVSLPIIAIEQGPVAAPVIVQSPTGSTSVSGPTTFTLTFASTQVGSALIAAVAVNSSAAASLGTTPTNWSLITSSSTVTLATGLYIYYNNPGGITSFTLSSPVATTGGIAAVGWEVQNCPFVADVSSNNAGSTTGANSGAAQLAPPATNNLVVGAIGWVAGAVTLTQGNTVPTGSITTNTARIVSTAGTTNAAIQGSIIQEPAMAASASNGFIIAGTLSSAVQWEGVICNLRSTASDYSVGSQQVDLTRQGPQVIGGGQQAISVGAL